MELLLDSHTLLWALYDEAVLPRSLASILRDPENSLFISEASVWELSDKVGKRRLSLAGNSVSQFVADIEAFGTMLLPIELADILASVVLPAHHGDPSDRLFMAQARARNLVLVSKDSDIAKYEVAVLWK